MISNIKEAKQAREKLLESFFTTDLENPVTLESIQNKLLNLDLLIKSLLRLEVSMIPPIMAQEDIEKLGRILNRP